jgi:hypothetical protein
MMFHLLSKNHIPRRYECDEGDIRNSAWSLRSVYNGTWGSSHFVLRNNGVSALHWAYSDRRITWR